MNNKGIMVKFLLTVLLALIIFTPACIFTSKLFQLSDQARDNFVTFVKELRSYADKTKNLEIDRGIVLLILDEQSGIFFFKNKEKQLFYSDFMTERESGAPSNQLTERNYYFEFPSQSCKNLPCTCLCRQFNWDVGAADVQSRTEGVTTIYTAEYILPCLELRCEDISDILLGTTAPIYRSQEENRRLTITLEKKDGTISIREQ